MEEASTTVNAPSAPLRAGGASGWGVVAAGAAIFSVTWGTAGAMGVLLNDAVSDLGWSRATFAGGVSLLVAGGMATAVLWGWLVDRWSARGVGLIAGGLFGAGLFLGAGASSPWQFYLTVGLLAGLGLGAMGPVIMAPTARWFTRRRGFALGVVTAGTGVGVMVMPQVAQLLLAVGDWSFALRALGIVTWVVIALTAWALREPPWFRQARLGASGPPAASSVEAAPARVTRPGAGSLALGQAVRTAPYWVLGCMFLVVMLNKEMVVLHLVPSGRELGLTGAAVASLATILGAGNVVAKVIAGYWADRAGPQRLFIAALAAQVLAMAGLGFGVTPGLFFATTAFMGFTYGAWVPLIPSMAAQAFGTRNMGTIFGSLMLVSAIGAVAGPLVGGWLFDLTHSYTAAYGVGAILALVAALLGLVFARSVSRSALAPRPAITQRP